MKVNLQFKVKNIYFSVQQLQWVILMEWQIQMVDYVQCIRCDWSYLFILEVQYCLLPVYQDPIDLKRVNSRGFGVSRLKVWLLEFLSNQDSIFIFIVTSHKVGSGPKLNSGNRFKKAKIGKYTFVRNFLDIIWSGQTI